MQEQAKEFLPKSKEEYEAYCRAMDEANDAVVDNAVKRDQKRINKSER